MSTDNHDGFFSMLRASHPCVLGQHIDGKKIVMTCYEWDEEEQRSVPVVRLEGESMTRRV